MSPEQLLQTLLQFLLDSTYIPAAGLGVVAFTNAIKFILTKAGLNLSDLAQIVVANLVQFVVWTAWMFFTRIGMIDQFTQWYEAAVTVVMALFPLLGGVFAAHKIYVASKPQPALQVGTLGAQAVTKKPEGAVPLLGYSVESGERRDR